MKFDRLVILGGLGYLGHEIERVAIQSFDFKKFVVVDKNIYGRWEQEELQHQWETISYTYLDENILNINGDELIEENDLLIVCSEIGNSEVCFSPEFAEYWDRYYDVVNSLSEKAARALVLRRIESSGHRRWWNGRIKSAETFELPFLYGTSPAINVSEPINNMVLEFALYKQYIMSSNPFQLISFAHVNDVAEGLLKYVLNDSKDIIENFSCVTFLSLCNLIQYKFGQDYGLGMASGVDYNPVIDRNVIQLKEEDINLLELLVSEIKVGLENGAVNELMKDCFNSSLIVERIKNSMKYKDFING